MLNFKVIFSSLVTIYCISFQSAVSQENDIFGELPDIFDDGIRGSGESDVPFLLPESLDEIKKINVFEKLREKQLGLDEIGDGAGVAAITEAHLLVKEIVDSGEDDVKVAGAAMNLFEEIKDIPKEIHESFKDSAKNVWDKAKKITGHAMKIPNQISGMLKKTSPTSEETGQSGSRGGFLGFRGFG